MSGHQVSAERSGNRATLLASLRAEFSGAMIAPDDLEYEHARKVWNGMIDKRPLAVARCHSVGDVAAAVRLARRHDLPIAIRGGGHNVAGYATCDDGLVIDLSPMKDIVVDPQARIAKVQGGATWGELDRKAQVHGLATPGGEVSVTGVAGLTLSGGIGYLRRKHGLSCDNVIAMEVVTADGTVRKASEHENADLYWALRGGGGNFGIVTSFEFRLHPLGPEVATATAAYPLEEAEAVLTAWRAFADRAPEEISSSALLWTLPDVEDFPPSARNQAVVIVDALYAGDSAVGTQALSPLRSLGTPLLDLSGVTPYVDAQSSFDAFFPAGDRYYWKSLNLSEVTDQAIATLLECVGKRPSTRSLVAIRHLGGAIRRVPAGATAFPTREAGFNVSIDASWSDPTMDGANRHWARQTWQEMQPFADGTTYLNFPGFLEEGDGLLRRTFGANYARLGEVKRKYDPDNIFRLNQNINPQTS